MKFMFEICNFVIQALCANQSLNLGSGLIWHTLDYIVDYHSAKFREVMIVISIRILIFKCRRLAQFLWKAV